jgi:uncharacterized protein YbjT (DUF2867 family)
MEALPNMDKTKANILVTGATGKQGGAAAHELLKRGWRVRALVRNPQKPEALALAGRGAELIQGDLDDRASLDPAIQGATGVFSVQNFWETGEAREIAQGKALADAAKAAGVQHFVYSSVGGAERGSGLSHFESKWLIEKHIHALGLPATILRPVFFMDNYESPAFRGGILQGQLAMGIGPNRTLQMIAVEDIGIFTALAFERPQEFLGKALEIAGDELTIPRAAEILSKLVGRPVKYVQQPIEQVRSFSKEYAEMYEWFEAKGYAADIPALRKLHPKLKTFEDWARTRNWASASA